jgi:transcription antitermination factor NusG
MSNRWFVVKSKASQEQLVDIGLSKIGFSGFYPTRSCIISHAGKKTEVLRPLFPLYTFAYFDRDVDDWGKIIRMRGVDTVLGVRRGIVGNSPSAVPHGVVERLIQIAEVSGGSIPVQGDQFKPLEHGARVRLEDGPFQGFSALVDADHKTRVKVLLDILGKETPIWVTRDTLSLESDVAT